METKILVGDLVHEYHSGKNLIYQSSAGDPTSAARGPKHGMAVVIGFLNPVPVADSSGMLPNTGTTSKRR